MQVNIYQCTAQAGTGQAMNRSSLVHSPMLINFVNRVSSALAFLVLKPVILKDTHTLRRVQHLWAH
jgi:hypothetical protein